MRFEIEPKIGLGNFILGMNINQVLTLIKRNGYNFKHCQIISGKEVNSPTFLYIPSEQINLRFNYYSQKLELIEKKIISLENQLENLSELNKDSEYYYKNKLFYTLNRETHYYRINYQNIAKLFGLSKVPKKLNKNKNIFLEYNGIGFYFTNIVKDMEKSDEIDASTENSSVNTESLLSKLFIFREDSFYDSLNQKNDYGKNNILIKYDSKKPKSIIIINENNKSEIKIGDHIEDVLREIKHPNYIHYSNEKNENYSDQEGGKVLYNQTQNKIYYLNYFQYGFDIMIINNKVSRIILHTNQVGDSKFGIYDRCNFKLKLRNDYLKTLLVKKDKNKESFRQQNNRKEDNDKKSNIQLKENNISKKSSINNEKLENESKYSDSLNEKNKENKEEKELRKEKSNNINGEQNLKKNEMERILKKEEKNEKKEEIKNLDKNINNKGNNQEQNTNKDKDENKKIIDKKEEDIKEEINKEKKEEENKNDRDKNKDIKNEKKKEEKFSEEKIRNNELNDKIGDIEKEGNKNEPIEQTKNETKQKAMQDKNNELKKEMQKEVQKQEEEKKEEQNEEEKEEEKEEKKEEYKEGQKEEHKEEQKGGQKEQKEEEKKEEQKEGQKEEKKGGQKEQKEEHKEEKKEEQKEGQKEEYKEEKKEEQKVEHIEEQKEEEEKKEDPKIEQKEVKKEEKKIEEGVNKVNESNNQTKNIYVSKNKKNRRRKHGNPPKRKNQINLDDNEEEEINEDEEESENNKIEIDTKEKKEEYISIYPWSDFRADLLSKFEYDKNLRHQKWDEGTSKIINCYFFKGLLFEIVDKNVIATVTIY